MPYSAEESHTRVVSRGRQRITIPKREAVAPERHRFSSDLVVFPVRG
jgi:hypothetical protein